MRNALGEHDTGVGVREALIEQASVDVAESAVAPLFQAFDLMW